MGKLVFDTTYLSLSFYWIGWKWGYAIMKIVDSNDEIKIRLSKCRILRDFPETEMYEWEDIDPIHINSLKQSNHVNFKSEREVDAIFFRLKESTSCFETKKGKRLVM